MSALANAAAVPARAGDGSRTDQAAPFPTGWLDAVRGLAACYVVLYHARLLLFISAASAATLQLRGLPRLLAEVGGLTRFGHVAVLAFFLVSGYAIHYRQAARLAAGDRSALSWRRYALRRARRLYPPLIAALLITFAFDQIGAHIDPAFYAARLPADLNLGWAVRPDSLSGLVGTLLFVQGVFLPAFGTDIPLWSLAYEAFFYLAYPLVFAASRRWGPLPCQLIFLVIGAVAALSVLVRPSGLAGLRLLFAYWPIWVAGVTLADFRCGRLRLPRRSWDIAALGGIVALASIALVVGRTQAADSGDAGWDALWVAALIGPVGWIAAAPHSGAVSRVAARAVRPFLPLGAMSYSLYVAHFPLLAFFSAVWLTHRRQLPATPWLLVTGVSIAFLVAVLVHIVAERPVLDGGYRRGANGLAGAASLPTPVDPPGVAAATAHNG